MPPFHRGNRAWLWSAASAYALLATARYVCVFVFVDVDVVHVPRSIV